MKVGERKKSSKRGTEAKRGGEDRGEGGRREDRGAGGRK